MVFVALIGVFSLAANVVVGTGLIVASGAMIFGYVGSRKRMSQNKKGTCVADGPAVAYHGWEGTVHTFKFRNAAFAQRFAHANQSKLLS